jgi:hypothetical protein
MFISTKRGAHLNDTGLVNDTGLAIGARRGAALLRERLLRERLLRERLLRD